MRFFSRIASKDTRPDAGSLGTGAPAVKSRKGVAQLPPMPDDKLGRALCLGRFGVIVQGAHIWAKHPQYASARATALNEIDELFALVPEGFAALTLTVNGEPG